MKITYLAITSIVLAIRIGCGGSFFLTCTKHVWNDKKIILIKGILLKKILKFTTQFCHTTSPLTIKTKKFLTDGHFPYYRTKKNYLLARRISSC